MKKEAQQPMAQAQGAKASTPTEALAKVGLPAERPGYKHTKLGWIPEEWKVLTLGSAFDFRNGYNADSTAYGRGVQFANVLEVITHPELNEALIPGRVEIGPDAHDLNSVRHGDVLLNRTSETPDEVGLTSVYTGTSTITFGGFVIRGRQTTDLFDIQFLKYGLRTSSVRKQIIAKSNGAVRSNIGQADLRQVLTSCPPLPEQLRIAQVLEAWDRAIATVQQLLAAQQERKRGLMQELLTGKRRFPGFEGKWKEVRLHQLGDITNGGTPSTTVDAYWNGDIPWFTPTEITALNGRTTIANSARMLTAAGLANCTGSMLPVGSVIVCTRATVGIAAILTKPGTTNQGFKNIVPNEKVSSKFLYYQIMINAHALQRLACGSTFPEVSMKDFRNLGVLIPERTEQDRICKMLDAMDLEIEAMNDQITHLTTQKRGLMQVLLTGEKRLNMNN